MNLPTLHDIMRAAEQYAEEAATFAERGFYAGFENAQRALGAKAAPVKADELATVAHAHRTVHRNAHLDSYLTGVIATLKLLTGDTTAEPWTDDDAGGPRDRARILELLERLAAQETQMPAETAGKPS